MANSILLLHANKMFLNYESKIIDLDSLIDNEALKNEVDIVKKMGDKIQLIIKEIHKISKENDTKQKY